MAAGIARIRRELQTALMHLNVGRFGEIMTVSYRRGCIALMLLLACLGGCQSSGERAQNRAKILPAKAAAVEARIETLVLPTYPVGKPVISPSSGGPPAWGAPAADSTPTPSSAT